jgi:hypothetical protein
MASGAAGSPARARLQPAAGLLAGEVAPLPARHPAVLLHGSTVCSSSWTHCAVTAGVLVAGLLNRTSRENGIWDFGRTGGRSDD